MGCGCGQPTSGGYHLIKPDGTVFTDARGTVLVFATRAEAEAVRSRHVGTVELTVRTGHPNI